MTSSHPATCRALRTIPLCATALSAPGAARDAAPEDRDAARLFHRLDANGGGRIARAGVMARNQRRLMQRHDADGDRRVSRYGAWTASQRPGAPRRR